MGLSYRVNDPPLWARASNYGSSAEVSATKPNVLELEGCLPPDELAFVPRFPAYRIASDLLQDGLHFLEEGASV